MRTTSPWSRCWFLVLGLSLWTWVASGAVAPTDGEGRTWTPDDLVLAEEVTDWAVARDGGLVVWVKSEARKLGDEEKRVSNLELGRLDTGERLILTRGNDEVSQPAFSPDGRHVGFLSTRELPADKKNDGSQADDEKRRPQLWAIALAGGEPFPVTTLDRPVIAFGWLDASTLLVAAQESPTAWENEREKNKDTARVVDDADHEPPVRLFTVTLDGKVRRLFTSDDWIDSLAVSPDGRWAVVNAQQSLSYEFDQRTPPHTRLIELASGREERLFADGVLLPQAVRWAPDGAGFYFTNPYTRHPLYRQATLTELHYFDLERRTVEKVDVGWERGVGGDFAPTAGGVIALLGDGVRFRPALLEHRAGSWMRRELSGTHAAQLDGWRLSAEGGAIVYATSTAVTPRQLWVARLEGTALRGEKRLTDLNPGWARKPTGKIEILRWAGARNERVEGILHYPLDWREGERRPLVLDIHGGPAGGADRDSWNQDWNSPKLLWRQRGAFVLEVNYHGSSDYGLDWVESIEGRYYELEIPDIETGVDHLIERGLVDPERLAATGWSNGGILAAELITRTRRYRAASIGAADVEWISDWANVDFGAAFDNYYFGGPPWEKTEVYLEKSPFFRLTEVTTPTIVHTGTEDRSVPPHQSWSLFRALQQIGKAPVRLVLYPGEPHNLQKIAHQRRKLEEDLAWLDRYLFATHEPENEALKKGSPLATLLERQRAASSGGRLGREEAGILVPETVAFQGLEVGRFEVTRAQLAAFDPSYSTASGADRPATGVSFEQAHAYAAWLAEKTGRRFRLPTIEEAEKLAEAAGDEGNTLDRWAGYDVNPDDAERLGALIGELGGEAALLLPVGSLPGKDGVFDLDGNAAEWAVGAGGEGVPAGPSADHPADERGRSMASPACTGLRVVIGK